MDGEQILGVIIMCFVGFGCGLLFYGIGYSAQISSKPMHFYSGTSVDPKSISDIPAYNRENARMWKIFSVPFWLTGIVALLSIFVERLAALCGILIGVACTVGIAWLVLTYRKIYNKYRIS